MLVVSKARRRINPPVQPPNLTPNQRQVQNIVETAFADLRPAAGSELVTQSLNSRNIQRVVDSFPWDETTATLELSQEVFSSTLLENIGKVQPAPTNIFTGMRFDVTDPRATEWAKTQSARLVTAVTDETKDIIRQVVSDAFTKNITVYDTAKTLRNVIGLNNRQFESYMKFTETLGNNLREQGLTGRAFNEAFDKMSTRQYDRMIKQRAEMIARTEISMAENNGQYLGWQQAVEQGYADPKSVKRWSTSTDERTCIICRPMNGMSVKWDESYPNGIFMPPAHPMCRCAISLLEPDSALAQNFMPPITPQFDPLTIAIPTLTAIQPAVGTPAMISIEDAVAAANTSGARRQSAFQYDAGDIENLNVTVRPVKFNGSPHTELTFKLTPVAQKNLFDQIKREGDKTKWEVSKGVVIIDKKNNKTEEVKFAKAEKTKVQEESAGFSNVGSEFVVSSVYRTGSSNGTFTRYFPDGTAIRVIKDQDNLFAFDGLVRVMIPGKATQQQVEAAMRSVGVKANRVPTAEDILNLKANRIVALFEPDTTLKYKAGSAAEMKTQQELANNILKKYGITLDDVGVELDDLGNMKFFLPDNVVEKIMSETKVVNFQHTIGSLETVEGIVDLILGGNLYSTTSRGLKGINRRGISSQSDIGTGGADYVFLTPLYKKRTSPDPGTMVFQPKPILRRTDWFAWRSDAFGVRNPNDYRFANRLEELTKLDWIEELKNGNTFTGELMVQHSLSLDALEAFYVDLPDDIIRILKRKGVTQIGGKPIEKVILRATSV